MSYNCEILADSLSPQGHRLTTMKITFPRFILAEFNTHRMFSRNSASSRAIPFKKMVKMVEENPFIPIAWQKDHKGMQGVEYITNPIEIKNCNEVWLDARDSALDHAMTLHGDYAIFDDTEDPYTPLEMGVTKQLCNRLLEPFMWHTVIVTASEWDNFFKLRCPQYETKFGTFYSKKDARNAEIDVTDRNPNIGVLESPDLDDTLGWLELNKSQAEIHIQAIAELMWDKFNSSKPKVLKSGQWHVPFGDKFDDDSLEKVLFEGNLAHEHKLGVSQTIENVKKREEAKIRIAVARAARISYETLGDNPKIDYEADLKLHDMLAKMEHLSPFEHVARVMDENEYMSHHNGKLLIEDQGEGVKYISEGDTDGWCRNFRGFIQYRSLID